jgi:hypothetical protein
MRGEAVTVDAHGPTLDELAAMPPQLSRLLFGVEVSRVFDDAVLLRYDSAGGAAAGLAEAVCSASAVGLEPRRPRTALGSGVVTADGYGPRRAAAVEVRAASARPCWRITAPSGRAWYVADDAFVYLGLPGSFKLERVAAPLVFEVRP